MEKNKKLNLGYFNYRSPSPTNVLFFGWIFAFLTTTVCTTPVTVCQDNTSQVQNFTDQAGRLILTPLIENGKASEGRDAARVIIAGIESYTGFITVNKTYNSNIFFWFVPAQVEPSTAPLILWLGNLPASTPLYQMFNENGPFFIDGNAQVHLRKYPLSLGNSMLYMENLVGAGFSFTDDSRGFSRSINDVTQNLYEALDQFFQLFPAFANRSLYIAGEYLPAKYAIALAAKIDPTNVSGIILGSPFVDPFDQLDYGNFLYHSGLVGERERQVFRELEDQTRHLIMQNRYSDAFKVGESLIVGYPILGDPSYFKNFTGFKYVRNILQASASPDRLHFMKFLDDSTTRQTIHVGSQQFCKFNATSYYAMEADYYQSSKVLLEQLLDRNLSVLVYSGQLDPLVPHTTVTALVNSLNWTSSREFDDAEKAIYRVNDDVVGYRKSARNLVHLVLRNAGNKPGYDQPLWTFNMINEFIPKGIENSPEASKFHVKNSEY